MPELAEVEFFRKQWDCGLRRRVREVRLNAKKRIFRGTPVQDLKHLLPGCILRESRSNGKWILFGFTRQNWLGIHLGMTGRLLARAPDAPLEQHDHLVLFQRRHQLVFRDPRLFGRVTFYHGPGLPAWWTQLPPAVNSPGFTVERLDEVCRAHRRLALKALLLDQKDFPGIGNWMADEILWQSRLHPAQPAGRLDRPSMRKLYQRLKSVSNKAMETIGRTWEDPPARWLFHRRWKPGQNCPRCRTPLERERIGGRTTCWCPKCQPLSP